jgi:hypothetical protein
MDPNSVEMGYLLGVSYLWLGQYENAIRELSNLLDKQAFYHKNVFILLSVAYKKTNNPQAGIKIVISHNPPYPLVIKGYRKIPKILRRVHFERKTLPQGQNL